MLPSPCGQNCTYTISFNGPSVECTSTNVTETVLATFDSGGRHIAPRFTAGWTPRKNASQAEYWGLGWLPLNESELIRGGNSDCYGRKYMCPQSRISTFFLSEHTPVGKPLLLGDGDDIEYKLETRRLLCTPQRVKYSMKLNFRDGSQSLNISLSDPESLNSLWDPTKPKVNPGKYEPVFSNLTYSIEVYNLFSLIDSFIQPLSGTNPSNTAVWNTTNRGKWGQITSVAKAQCEQTKIRDSDWIPC